MNKWVGTIFVGLSLLTAPARADGVINLLNYADYMTQDQINRFEKETGIKIITSPIDSNEVLLSKLKTSKDNYDAAVATDYMVDILRNEKLIEPVGVNKLQNYGNLLDTFHAPYYDPTNEYAMPYQFGTTSIMVDTKVLPNPPASLTLLFDPPEEIKGKINVHKDMHDVINAALRYLNYPRCNSNPEQLKEVVELLKKSKPNFRSINSAGTVDLLASGDVAASQVWSGAALRARKQRPTLQYVYTKEGFTGWVDSLVVVDGAKNAENVKIFMNWLMDPKNSAELTNGAGYASPVKGAEKYLTEELRTAPEANLPKEPKPEFVPNCSPEVIKLYDKIWTNFLK